MSLYQTFVCTGCDKADLDANIEAGRKAWRKAEHGHHVGGAIRHKESGAPIASFFVSPGEDGCVVFKVRIYGEPPEVIIREVEIKSGIWKGVTEDIAEVIDKEKEDTEEKIEDVVSEEAVVNEVEKSEVPEKKDVSQKPTVSKSKSLLKKVALKVKRVHQKRKIRKSKG